MEVDRGTSRMELDVEQAPQAREDRGPEQLVEASVPHQHCVRFHQGRMLAKEMGEGDAVDLFLTLQHEAHVDWQPAGSDEVLHRLDRGHVIALVVRGATRIQMSVAHGWNERRRLPQVDWVRGLHVVMAVDG